MLSHERLDVYRLSVDLLREVLFILRALTPGSHDVASQLRRAAMSISLNIAEGAGRTGVADKKRYYSIARGSTLETAALLDVLVTWEIIPRESLTNVRMLLERVAAMLGAMTTRP